METLKFKTNINCSGCVMSVKPSLNKVEDIKSWTVNIEDSNKVLTVKANDVSEVEIIKAVEAAGFEIHSINT